MHEQSRRRSAVALAGQWLSSLGLFVRLSCSTFSVASFAKLKQNEIRFHCQWMGESAVPLIAISAVFISVALTAQVVMELQRFGAQDLAGPMIALGLLRELGPLTVSILWCSRIAAFIAAEAHNLDFSEADYASKFMLPRYIAALYSGIPLSVLGLVLGFIAAALYAPILGVSSAADFVEGARPMIKNKDVVVFFVKLLLVNPTIAVFVSAFVGRSQHSTPAFVVANAVTATVIVLVIANYAVSFAFYMP